MTFVERNKDNLSQFRLLVCGSDQWTMGEYRAIKKICGKDSRVISSYGLTETTIDSSFYEEIPLEVPLEDKSIVPIGKPFKHANIYLINDNELAAHGETGEIYISGTGVGLGYLNQPDLTKERFVDMHIHGVSKKLYKTGDQGKILSDGNFLFLGRNQEHIKIHGNRVDLPSLEATINQHPKVKFALIIPMNTTQSDGLSLKCFFTLSDDSLTFEEITTHIKKELPCYYVPKEFYQIEAIPLSLNGKIDRRINSQKIIKEIKPTVYAATSAVQKYLVSVWKEILDINEVGIKNNFYSLGGSSLLFVAMLERINAKFNLNIHPDIEIDTVEKLASYIEKQQFLLKKNQPLLLGRYYFHMFYSPLCMLSIANPHDIKNHSRSIPLTFFPRSKRLTCQRSIAFSKIEVSEANFYNFFTKQQYSTDRVSRHFSLRNAVMKLLPVAFWRKR